MFLFMFCVAMAAGGFGFVGGVLLVGATAYDRGWQAHVRQQAEHEAERLRAGFRVVR